MTRRRRLDDELVEQGFFSNRADAMRAVMAGDVSTTGRRHERAGEQVEPGIPLHVRGHIPFVSRGGLKLERGLEAFGVDAAGLACLDVGCSTGGFTDCLLKHGAASVLSVDVGYAQFDWSLRGDARVTLLERTNIVDVPSPERAGTIQLAVCDVSAMLSLDPEAALHAACEKFIRRFALVEQSAGEQALTAMTEAQLIELWELAKAASAKERER